ncbi:MAG: MmgE/PrpD family protein [Rhodobacteraceae bacterium]|nr:MmgE/PrpD family protein [Paracoccaceae bacterium]
MTLLAERLAAFAAAPVRPSPEARAILALSALDWAAVGIAGVPEPVATLLREMAAHEGGRPEASALGHEARLPARAAALVNGATSHALDYDDTHFAHIGHPSVVILPASLAAAEVAGAGMEAMQEAALIGAEVSIRVGLWLGRGHYETGFHQTATAGAFGAAAAAARLLGCGADGVAHALGLVSTRAAGLKSQFGTMGKPYNAGLAAAGGLEAALLARAGFVSAPAALDGPQGFGPTHAGAGDLSAFDGLGEEWLFPQVAHKFHACCHGLHAMLEALGTLAPGTAPDQVEGVEVAVHPRWRDVCDIAQPRTGLEAKFSYRLTAAMALAGRETAALSTFSQAACTDPALMALAERVEVRGDASLPDTVARVRLRLRGGAAHEAAHDLAAPMPLEARAARVRRKAAALLGEPRAQALEQALAGPALEPFCALLRKPCDAGAVPAP